MIKAIFTRDAQGEISQFSLTGHADSGDYGHDLVCSAVSAVSIGAVNGIEALAGFQPDVDADEVNGGHLVLALEQPVNGEQEHIAQILLENLLLSLTSIEENYGDYLHVTTQQQA
ncbi:ribosomal-processing cysteine protease Prp [Lacticaseibacillus salsurivasis]|uniref:ribosomal-processing cysteine protease Prp n=1 Tax=Lacticaseibacillus salsurivasis TaxID=3081441 RepID=UPI0030C687B6